MLLEAHFTDAAAKYMDFFIKFHITINVSLLILKLNMIGSRFQIRLMFGLRTNYCMINLYLLMCYDTASEEVN